MAEIGVALMYFALGFCLYAVIAGVVKLRSKADLSFADVRWASGLATAAVTGAVAVLVQAFLTDNFRLAYVAQYSERSLSLIYKISALWAGQSGSLLLWLFLLSLLVLVVHKSQKYRRSDLDIKLSVVVNLVRLCFVGLLLFAASPFATLSLTPLDGSGLNPMLQSFGMVVHPPIVFLGYSLTLLPFALAVVGLVERSMEDTWLVHSRIWILLAWAALTAGIVTGGQWAYTELGWGGYWAWDPVENASLFPWLTLTALLHTYLLPNAGWSKKLWSYILIAASFALSLFGSFLTRSGVLDSVHAFASGLLGYSFLLMLAFTVIVSFYLLVSRRSLLVDPESDQGGGWLTRSGSITASFILLLVILVGVLVGTLSPLISRTFGSREAVLGEEYYNLIAAPLFLAVVLLMGLTPLWQGRQRLKLIVSGGGAVLVFIAGLVVSRGQVLVSISFAVGAFALLTHVTELALDWWSKRNIRTRKMGAYLVHLGIVVMVFGIAGSSVFKEDVLVSIKPGEVFEFGGYEFHFDDVIDEWTDRDYQVSGGLAVYQNEKYLGTISSSKTFTDVHQPPYTDIGILSRFAEDLYLNLAGRTPDFVQFHIQRFPLVSWIWAGSYLCYLGVLVVILASRRKKGA